MCLKTLIDDANQPVSFVRFMPNSKYLLASTLDSTLRLWAHEDGKVIKTYTGHTNTRFCIFTSFARDFIVSGSEDNNAYVWSLNSRNMLQTLKGHSDCVIGVDLHIDREILATSSMGNEPAVKLWRNTARSPEEAQPTKGAE